MAPLAGTKLYMRGDIEHGYVGQPRPLPPKTRRRLKAVPDRHLLGPALDLCVVVDPTLVGLRAKVVQWWLNLADETVQASRHAE